MSARVTSVWITSVFKFHFIFAVIALILVLLSYCYVVVNTFIFENYFHCCYDVLYLIVLYRLYPDYRECHYQNLLSKTFKKRSFLKRCGCVPLGQWETGHQTGLPAQERIHSLPTFLSFFFFFFFFFRILANKLLLFV